MIETNYIVVSMRGKSAKYPSWFWYNNNTLFLKAYKCVWVWWSLTILFKERWNTQVPDKITRSIHIVIWIMIFNTFDALNKMHCFIFWIIAFCTHFRWNSIVRRSMPVGFISLNGIEFKGRIPQKLRKNINRNCGFVKKEKKCHKFEACQQIFFTLHRWRFMWAWKMPRLHMNIALVFNF